MKHYDEETILKYVLETLDEDESSLVNKHLEGCEICKTKIDKAKNEIEVISSFDPNIEEIEYVSELKSRYSYDWLKRVAVLVIGFISGYLTSTITQTDHVNVVEQKLIPKSLQVPTLEFTSCISVDVWEKEY